jgi:hypothetical protein
MNTSFRQPFPTRPQLAISISTTNGTTPDGGEGNCQFGCGVIFRLSRKENWANTVLYYFQGGSDGFDTFGSLVMKDRDLYGTTVAGGNLNCSALTSEQGCGVVFRVSP